MTTSGRPHLTAVGGHWRLLGLAVRPRRVLTKTAEVHAGEQRAYLDDFWAQADVELDGDAGVQQAVRFGLFHVLQAGARAEGRAWLMAVPVLNVSRS